MLHRTRALTLSGPGGIGKTRLALRLLASAAAEFPDGVWFVELADLRQPDLVVSRIAAVIGITEEAGRPLLETLGDALRSRRLLLALDNCEHLLDACAQVGRHLLASAPGLRLLKPAGSRCRSRPRRSGGCRRCRWPRRARTPAAALGAERYECGPATRRPPRPPPGFACRPGQRRGHHRDLAGLDGIRWRSSWPRPGPGAVGGAIAPG